MGKTTMTISLVYFSHLHRVESVLQCLSERHVDVEAFSISNWQAHNPDPQAPDVLFIDTRFISLNSTAQRQLQEFVKRLPRRVGLAIVTRKQAQLSALLEPASNCVREWQDSSGNAAVISQLITQHTTARNDAEQLANVLHNEFLHLNLIGSSPTFRRALTKLKKLSRYDAPVLIRGETGTGKEMVARAIHYFGERQRYPFIPVDCGAIPENLVENELFGHERGAYTDARQSQLGLVAQAEGGTLFLDEIDALPAKAQVALLRFLQSREYRALGSQQSHKADVRVITATNADLSQQVADERFRQDLLFRIDILSLDLPPLRERSGDVERLVDHFLEKFTRQYRQAPKHFDEQSLQWLQQQDWPGNVRELENFVHREFLLADKSVIRLEVDDGTQAGGRRMLLDRRQDMSLDLSFTEAKTRVVREFEEKYLRRLMQQSGGNVTEAARIAGKERRALGKLLKKYGIDKSEFSC